MDFIVDVGIIRAKEEALPAGWERLQYTIGGHDANLNVGFPLAAKLFVCFQRGRGPQEHPLIITEIGVVEVGRDAVPPGCRVISRTITDKTANLNQGSGGSKLHLYVRSAPRSQTEQGLLNLAVVRPRKGEQAPAGWQVIDKDLNKGSIGEEVRLAYELARMIPFQAQAQAGAGPTPTQTPTMFQSGSIAHQHQHAPAPAPYTARLPPASATARSKTATTPARKVSLLVGVPIQLAIDMQLNASLIHACQMREHVPSAADVESKFAYDFTKELRVLADSAA